MRMAASGVKLLPCNFTTEELAFFRYNLHGILLSGQLGRCTAVFVPLISFFLHEIDDALCTFAEFYRIGEMQDFPLRRIIEAELNNLLWWL